jgi:4-aminobutyrate aminotransferase / (S)-3-amino-2-methylpropionate transaminase / 5-aminovalerate transaminase
MQETMAKIVTEIPGPKSLALFERRKAAVARGISYSFPLFAKEAKGALIKDVDDNVYVDFAAGIGVINAGHCDEEIVKAIQEQAAKYIHTSFNVCMYEPYIELAEKLIKLAPGSSPKKAMFANSGAEAVENAVKIARKYTGKTGIVSLEGSFHGRTYLTMTMTSKAVPYKDGFAPFLADSYKIPCPNEYRNPLPDSGKSCGLACAEYFETMLHTTLSPEMIACVVIEPVQGEGGFIPLPAEYLEKMQEICHKNHIVFIIDEIQAGFGRTGKLFSCMHANVEPDLITMSKSIAAGLPLSAVIGKAEIMDAPIPGSIGGTFSGNPVACAAALKVLEKMEKDALPERANGIGEYIMVRLNAMKAKYSVIGDVRGQGAMIGLEFVKDRETKEPNKEIVGLISNACPKRGVILINAGLYSNCIRFLPPLVITDEQLKYGMDVLDAAISESL